MAIERKFENVTSEDDPDRCRGVHARGQCQYRAVAGSQFCPMHGGKSAEKSRQKQVARMYNLALWQSRTEEFTDDAGAKTLREEIGIARMVLEQVLLTCKSPGDILLHSGKIGEMLARIEKLVSTCHGIEMKLGTMLDKSAALHLAARFIEIIGEYVTDEDVLIQIGGDMAAAVAGLKPAEVTEEV